MPEADQEDGDFPIGPMPGFVFIEPACREMAARAWVAEIVMGSGEVPLTADTLSFCELMTQWLLNGTSRMSSKLSVVRAGA
ncbi:MAG: hypothetical protein GC190_20965 [Alphaproteobacteria bacterium]|nr:hypothetical protein [Alphaproteobacteria bacterium]